ncbi:MAG: gamma carbonic anhydrase family protein [Pigmentiphaga sp.]|nr:gamma carbonic anhydrase family protein [Pigmentiphaga sp.]
MAIYQFDNAVPTVSDSSYVAENAAVIGNVVLHPDTSVWFSAVIRGDNDLIEIGQGSNIQEGAVLHTDEGIPMRIGEQVTVGHQAMLHGCTVEAACLIGMQAILLNRCIIGKYSIVAAGAVVTEGKVFPERSLIMGAPAKVVRALTDEEVEKIHRSAQSYVKKQARFRSALRRLD